jgi:hypothetical protein
LREIEDRDEVEVGNWAKHKKTHFYSSGSQKKLYMNSLIYFSFPTVTLITITIFKFVVFKFYGTSNFYFPYYWDLKFRYPDIINLLQYVKIHANLKNTIILF